MRITISRKLTFLILLAAFGTLAVAFVQSMSLRTTIWQDRRELLQAQVQSAVSVLQFYADEAASGRLTREAAERAAHDAVGAMRYGRNEYLFAYRPNGTRVIHIDKKLEGKSGWDEKDANGFFHIRALIETAKAGGGFTSYYRSRPGETEAIPKLSYTTVFAPWNWTVGTGVYVDDLATIFRNSVAQTGLWTACILVVLCVAAYLIARSISRPIVALTSVMEHLATGDKGVAIPGGGRRDEIGAMAGAVQVFKDAAIEKDRLEAQADAARSAQAASQARQSAIDNAKAEDLRAFVHLVEASFERLAQGDLTVRMAEAVAAEFEPIRHRFNASVGALEGTIGAVVGAVGTLRSGLGEISAASTDLAQRTEQQAANLEETVAALSEVARGVNDTAAGAGQAQASASATQKDAEAGGAIVAQAVAAMSEIERSSNEIGKIIGVIDEIAFQTNLLALNAGVEAARAGEAGRGFAVVAQEVRGLAQRSAEAAKEIKNLISTSSAQVGRGVQLVSASGRSLDGIVDKIAQMNRVVAAIARSAQEQASSLREVSTAADQMDKVTQQNAAMVEETTAAAQSLTNETEQLGGMVEGFKASTPASHAAATRASRPAAAARPVMQMRATSSVKAAPAAQSEDWAEF